ncbi:hypothetical protein FEM48_Zijuj10G0129300 [Ziziphus jujuba var. spinosa]|uniref:Transmembrane protein n=1 Tax=Ziziphus jujuba var. spinosa TaxID=714518 RepID=A0A978UNI1_ZIZJJ|nr:hypothetical protein FEM48_Zijuj10G0129300 [Ziziphus jujuba var. spinosa]
MALWGRCFVAPSVFGSAPASSSLGRVMKFDPGRHALFYGYMIFPLCFPCRLFLLVNISTFTKPNPQTPPNNSDLSHIFSSIRRDLNFIDHTSDIGWKE